VWDGELKSGDNEKSYIYVDSNKFPENEPKRKLEEYGMEIRLNENGDKIFTDQEFDRRIAKIKNENSNI
jgi:hypothetical protein